MLDFPPALFAFATKIGVTKKSNKSFPQHFDTLQFGTKPFGITFTS